MRFLSVICVSFLLAGAAFAETLHTAVLILPDNATSNPFQKPVAAATSAAAKDLGCNLEIQESRWDQLKMAEQLEKRLQATPKPDVVIFANLKRNGPKILALLDKYQVKGFIFNMGLDADQQTEEGKPREKHPYWIGQLVPDDVGAGRITGELLYQRAKAKGLAKDGKIRCFGIEGNHVDTASIDRVKGLNEVTKAHPDFQIVQIVPGTWELESSAFKTEFLMRRYPDVNVIWAANDASALGVIKAVKQAGKVPGKDIITTGIDWVSEALDAIQADELEGSAGGHFMDGAWAMVLIYDYFNGVDFAKKEGVCMLSPMNLLTREELARYKSSIGKGDWSWINFKKFSKSLNPGLTDYNFGLTNLLK